MKKEEIEQLFEEFNNEFDIKIEDRRKKTPILMKIFQQFSDEIYKNSEIFKSGVNQKQEIIAALKLDYKQQKLIERYDELECLILDDMTERAFLYGFSVAKRIEEEKTRIKSITGKHQAEHR